MGVAEQQVVESADVNQEPGYVNLESGDGNLDSGDLASGLQDYFSGH